VVEAGWYSDPWDPSRTRWWDGTAWTAHVGGGSTSDGLPPLSGPPPAPPAQQTPPPLALVPQPEAPGPGPLPGAYPAATNRSNRGLLVGAAAGAALLLLAVAVGAVVVLGGGDDGGNAPPDLDDIVIGSDADEDEFCTDVERLAVLRDTASPAAWAEAITRMATHAHDEDAEAFAAVSLAYFRWVVDGQRSQALFDEYDDAVADAPEEQCGSDPFFIDSQPSADFLRLEEQAQRLADEQELEQPENRFFVDYGMATVVFSEPTDEQLLAVCEAWGDQPYQSLAEDGLVILGQSNDDIEVLEDPVVVRTGVDEPCELLEPTG
jgi:hypothetical protein